MANRRNAAKSKVQIDPILQPEWAANQAVREAQQRKQLAVLMSSKQLRANKAGDGSLHVVMRQPSTMADKYALPSHLTKQLGQPSRRTFMHNASNARCGSPSQDISTDSVPPLFERPSQSSPLQRPERAYTDSMSASISRSAVNDISVNAHTSGGGAAEFYGPSVGSTSRREMGSASVHGPEISGVNAADMGMPELYQVDGSAAFCDTQDELGMPSYPRPPPQSGASGSGIAWPGLNDESVGGRSYDSGRAAQRVSHPRVVAFSPNIGAASVPGQGPSSGRLLNSLPQKRPSLDSVERLVPGVDWSVAASEGGRRASYAIGAPHEGNDAEVPPREQSSAPVSSGSGGLTPRQVSVVDSTGDTRRGVSRTISSRDPRGGSHLPSPLGGRLAFTEKDGKFVSTRWTAGGSVAQANPTAVATGPHSAVASSADLDAPLPGSADGFVEPQRVFKGSFSQREYSSQPQRASPLRSRGVSFGTDLNMSAGASGGGGGGGSSGGGAAIGSRCTSTWSGMVTGPILADVQSGPAVLLGASDAQLLSAPPGSRAARAQALLARNKSNLSRLAATATGSVDAV